MLNEAAIFVIWSVYSKGTNPFLSYVGNVA